MAREEERRRIRRDLHDGLGPALSGVVFRLESARLLVDRDPAAATAHIDATTQRSVISNLRTELDRVGLSGVAISASDETNYDLARTTWSSFDSATKDRVRQVNVHGYQGLSGRRDLRKAVRPGGRPTARLGP